MWDAKPIRNNGKRVQTEIMADPIELLQLQNISDGLNNGCPSVVLVEIQHRLCSRRCHRNHADLLAASISVNTDVAATVCWSQYWLFSTWSRM